MILPEVSVIVLNYNGKHYLQNCFDALIKTDYPSQCLELIMADNGSSDGSIDFIKKKYPQVKIIDNGANLGFAAGNNRAITLTQAPFVVLLNNDTQVASDWLKPLINTALAANNVGACTSKLLFYYRPLQVLFTVLEGAFVPRMSLGLQDSRTLSVRIGKIQVSPTGPGAKLEYKHGFYGEEKSENGSFRWLSAVGELEVPVQDITQDLHIKIEILGGPLEGLPPALLEVHTGGKSLAKVVVDHHPQEIELVVPTGILTCLPEIIQNAGSDLLKSGHGQDRGSGIADNLGLFDKSETVFAGCGASILLRRAMLDEVGLFDPRYFMYYEDTDLSWRARLAGWELVFVPGSRVRHVHCGSSVEHSPLFIYYTERNRLIMLLKLAPVKLALSENIRYTVNIIKTLCSFSNPALLKIKLRVLIYLLLHLPLILAERKRIRARAKITNREIVFRRV